MLNIDKLSRTPIYEQVVAQIEERILLGDFTPGEPLPSVRALAVTLGINPNTLQKAYTELERQNLTKSVPGSGRFVCEDAQALLRARAHDQKTVFMEISKNLFAAGFTREQLRGLLDEACGKDGAGGLI